MAPPLSKPPITSSVSHRAKVEGCKSTMHKRIEAKRTATECWWCSLEMEFWHCVAAHDGIWHRSFCHVPNVCWALGGSGVTVSPGEASGTLVCGTGCATRIWAVVGAGAGPNSRALSTMTRPPYGICLMYRGPDRRRGPAACMFNYRGVCDCSVVATWKVTCESLQHVFHVLTRVFWTFHLASLSLTCLAKSAKLAKTERRFSHSGKNIDAILIVVFDGASFIKGKNGYRTCKVVTIAGRHFFM